jgi:hypothetical protein
VLKNHVGEFIDSRGFRVIHQPFHLPRNSTLGEFLSHGPNIQGNFDHESWLTYKDAVRRLLNEPASREWLDQDMENFLDWDKLERSVAAEQGNPASNEVTGQMHEEETEEGEDLNEEERDDDGDAIVDVPRQPSRPWDRIRPFILERLVPPLGAGVCILNITAALAYVMLMNDPTPPRPSYIAG